MDISKENIERISKDRNEPKWLLEERLRQLKIYNASGAKIDFNASNNEKLEINNCIYIDPFDEEDVKKAGENGLDITNLKKLFLSATSNTNPKTAFIAAAFRDFSIILPSKESKEILIGNSDPLSIRCVLAQKDVDIIELNKNHNYSIEHIDVPDNITVRKFFSYEGNNSYFVQSCSLGSNSKLYFASSSFSELEMEILNIINGNNSEVDITSVFFIDGKNNLRINSVLEHKGTGTRGNMLIKGIVKDRACAKMDGLIKIAKGAVQSNSFLEEHAMLLNPGAYADANPELEIENNDVRCTHSASVGEIDEEKLFYLMSRGLTREEAKRALIEGFIKPVLEKIQSESVKEKIEHRIDGISI